MHGTTPHLTLGYENVAEKFSEEPNPVMETGLRQNANTWATIKVPNDCDGLPIFVAIIASRPLLPFLEFHSGHLIPLDHLPRHLHQLMCGPQGPFANFAEHL